MTKYLFFSIYFLILFPGLTACSSQDNMLAYCQDKNGNIHFKAVVPPLHSSAHTSIPGLEDFNYDGVIFLTTPYILTTWEELEEIGTTAVFIVSYGSTELEQGKNLMLDFLQQNGYCDLVPCETREFEIGDKSGYQISRQMKQQAFLWYCLEYIFQLDDELFHVSFNSIRPPEGKEFDVIISSFTKGPAPKVHRDCLSEYNISTYNPDNIFKSRPEPKNSTTPFREFRKARNH
ncbi:MAG: hypothetical protein ACQES9_06610 [Myxococcota bacterium]